MEQILVMGVAAQLTNAACNNLGLGTNRMISPDLNSDPTQKTLDLKVWEIFRAYYNGIIQALADPTDWPPPAIPQGTVLPGILQTAIQSALPALSPALASGPLGTILSGIIKALPTAPSPAPLPAKIPDPGTPAALKPS